MPIILQLPGTNLFGSGADILVNAVNTRGVMGAGLALQFKQRYPGMFAAYRDRCQSGLVSIGSLDVHIVETHSPRRVMVANFLTKEHWSDRTVERDPPAAGVRALSGIKAHDPPRGAWHSIQPLRSDAYF